MKSLFIRLYFLLIGCFLLSDFLSDYIQNRSYREHISTDFVDYAHMLTQSMLREEDRGADIEKLSQWWIQKSNGEIAFIEVTSLDDERVTELLPLIKPQLLFVQIDEITDIIEVAVPADDSRVLIFRFHDEFSEYYIATYYTGFLILFLITAPAVYFVSRYVYRYLKQLQISVRNIVEGNYGASAPASSIEPFQELSIDINILSRVLADKVNEQQIFNGAIGHELLTPITRIQFALELAKNSGTQKECQELLTDMNEDIEELIRLTDNVMQLANACLPDHQAQPNEFLLSHKLYELTQRNLDERITTDIATGVAIVSDPRLVETVCNNLINNACKYARDRVHISLQESAGTVLFSVEDDGTGIEESERRNIFKPFYRIDGSRSRDSGGHGLGLAIVAELVRKSQGTIHVDRSELGGARFDVIWNYKKNNTSESQH